MISVVFISKEVRGETISTSKRLHQTSDEDTKMKVHLLQNQQRMFWNKASKNDRQTEDILLQLDRQKEINRKNEEIINDLTAKFKDIKQELPKLKAEKNKLQHQHDKEKKDNEQRIKNVVEQLTNHEKRFEDVSTQLTPLAKHTKEIDAIHSSIDSVNQAQTVIRSSLEKTNDCVDRIQSEMKADLTGATSKLMESQTSLAENMQENMENLFAKQQIFMQKMISEMSVEKPVKKKDRHSHNCT